MGSLIEYVPICGRGGDVKSGEADFPAAFRRVLAPDSEYSGSLVHQAVVVDLERGYHLPKKRGHHGYGKKDERNGKSISNVY